MNKELACIDIGTTYNNIQKAAFFVADKKFNSLIVPLCLLSQAKHYLDTTKNVKLGITIDHPYGLNPTEIKSYAILHALRKGAEIIDVVINHNLVYNENWKDLLSDCETCYKVCNEKKPQIRFIVDYRMFNIDTLITLCKAIASMGGDSIISTNGIGPDDPMDNIIASQEVQKKCKIPVIVSSPMFKAKHIEIMNNLKGKIFGWRIVSLGAAENIFGKIGE